VTRDEAVTYVSDRLADYLDAASREASDNPGKTLRPVIDDALRAMGVGEDSLALYATDDPELVIDFQVQVIYRALLQLNRDLGATMINYSGAGKSYSLQAIRQAVREDLQAAAEDVDKRFGAGSGYIDLGFLAPIPEYRVI
jgi:hypothetical protein